MALLAGLPGAAAEPVRAGVAAETFELPRWVSLAGYSRRRGRASQGVRDPVGVRALVIRDDDTAVALVSADLLIVDERLMEAVRARLQGREDLADLSVLLAATHTHSGPGNYGATFLERLSMGHYEPQVFEALAQAIAQAIRRAAERLEPVRVGCSTSAAEGLVTNRMDPQGVVDDELTVCTVQRADGGPLALLLSFAAHPTTLGAWNRRLSADYPGEACRTLEAGLPGTTCLFFAGAVADQAPVKVGADDEPARHLGQRLAELALPLTQASTARTPQRLQVREERLPLPPPRVRLSQRLALPATLSRRLADDDAALVVARIGPATIIGVPCDLSAEQGQTLKRAAAAHGSQPVLAGFANDYVGYCLPASRYDDDAYEARLMLNGPEAGERIVQRLLEMMDEIDE
jgi:hypothetical protein